MVCIILNSIILAVDGNHVEWEFNGLDIANIIFYFIFLTEMILKLIGLGFKGYFRDRYNILDFLVILCSTFTTILYIQSKERYYHIFKSLKSFRLVRLFKIAKRWDTLNYLLTSLGEAIIDLNSFLVLLFLFIFTYSILGMEWFANKAIFDLDNKIDLEGGVSIM